MLEENHLGVFAFPKYNCYKHASGHTVCDDITAEYLAMRKYPMVHPGSAYYQDPKLQPSPKALADIVTNTMIRVYTANTSYVDEVVEFSSYTSSCLNYYHYQLANQESRKAVFGTSYDLLLDHFDYPEIDRAIEEQYVRCTDCSVEFEPVKTFATMQGINDIYFTYTDTFPLNDKLNYPARSIRMQLHDGTLVSLWSESIDLFGCSCL